jgi:hypothetical protein
MNIQGEENIPGGGLRALIELLSIELTISRRMAAPSRVYEKRVEFQKQVRLHIMPHLYHILFLLDQFRRLLDWRRTKLEGPEWV